MYGVESSYNKPSVDHNEISGTFGWWDLFLCLLGLSSGSGPCSKVTTSQTYVGCSAGVLLSSGGLTLGFP